MASFDSTDDLEQTLSDAFESTPRVTVNTGPMSDGPERTLDVDFVDSVSVTEDDDDDLGDIYLVEVYLTIPRHEYTGAQHGNAVYAVLADEGVDRPDDSPRHGVHFSGGTVSVSAYVPAAAGDAADSDEDDE